MSADQKTIDLIISAQLKGGKTLESVTESIKALEKALEEQASAAKRGESSIDDLRATLLQLQRVQDQIGSQSALITHYQKLSNALDKITADSEKAAAKHDKYAASLKAGGEATEKQNNELIRLARSAAFAENKLRSQVDQQERLGKVLREAGVELDKIGETQNRVRESQAQLGVTINKTHDAIATYTLDVRKANDANRQFAEEQAFKKKLQDAENLVRASASVRIWEQSLKGANLAEQQMLINDALRKTADEAVAAARGYKTLGTAAQQLGGSSSSLRAMVDGILDPAAQARKTLDGLENEIRDIGTAVTSINGPVNNYREQIQQLSTAQKEIASQAAMVDQFTKQAVALRQARTEFSQARAQVLQYADALRQSGTGNTELSASLSRAQRALIAARNNLQEQINTSRQMRSSLADAGIATDKLRDAQTRLTGAAQSSVRTMQQLRAAHQQYGESVRQSAKANEFFNTSGRTTLSFLQRLRGELLSMAAAYVGVYAAVRGGSAAIDSFNQKISIQNQLSVAVGNDAQKIGDAYKYIHEQSERLGLDFAKAGPQFATFAASAKLAGRSTQETKYIFESFAETGQVLNLSGEKMEKVFFALQQMMSKGKIGAEELNQQLGDALPGAFGQVQEALKGKFPDLAKAMKEGKVGVENLVDVAEHLRLQFADRLPKATKTLQASQNNLNTALFDFKVMIAEAGFADEFAKLIQSLSEFFKSEDGKKFAQGISDALVAIVSGLRAIVENAELVKEVLIAGVLIAGSKQAFIFSQVLMGIPAQLRAINLAAAGASKSMRGLMYMFGIVAAAAAGWAIGAILREKFVEVRQFGVALVIGFEKLWVKIKYTALIFWEDLKSAFSNGLAGIVDILAIGFRNLVNILSFAAKALGMTALGEALDKAASAIDNRFKRIGNASAELRKKMEQDLEAIDRLGFDMWQDAANPPAAGPKVGPPTGTTDKPEPNAPGGMTREQAEERLNLKKQLEKELHAMDVKAAKNEQETLQDRHNAIVAEYQDLADRIRALGGKEGAAMEISLTQKINKLKEQETDKYNKALLKEQETLQNKLEQIEVKAGLADKTNMEARLEAVKKSYADTYREIDELRKRLIGGDQPTTAADLAKNRLDAGVLALQNLERQAVIEDQLNSALGEQKAKLELINVQRKNDIITQQQAFDKSSVVISETQPKIDAIVRSGLEYIQMMRDAGLVTEANAQAIAEWEAKLIAAREAAKGLRTKLFEAAQVDEMLADGLVDTFETIAAAFGDAINNVHSWSEAWKVAGEAFKKFAADFLMEISRMILKVILLRMLEKSGWGGMIAGAGNAIAGSKHRGGLVTGGGPYRKVDPAWFANAPRFHGGGVVGLGSNEVPIIARKNEEVLSENDPRNVVNGGASPAAPQQNLKIINMIDSGSVVSEGLSSEPGTKAMFNFIRANRTGLKQILAS